MSNPYAPPPGIVIPKGDLILEEDYTVLLSQSMATYRKFTYAWDSFEDFCACVKLTADSNRKHNRKVRAALKRTKVGVMA